MVGVTINALALFFTLLFTAFACILMGAGIPTTATYIILVSVAAPALSLLGVEPIVSHFLRVLLRRAGRHHPAGGARGLCGRRHCRLQSVPDRQHGAFRLGIAKALVPFVFVYSPALLIVTEGFTWEAFAITLTGATLGIVLLAGAFTGFIGGAAGKARTGVARAGGAAGGGPGTDDDADRRGARLTGAAAAGGIAWRSFRSD